jgi:hypothetical protein
MDWSIVQRADAYRREARRLRATLHERPSALYTQLRELADRSDALTAAKSSVPQSGVADFALRVARHLQNGILPYSDRLALLTAASEWGIDRFEANLIIAAVQNRLRPQH